MTYEEAFEIIDDFGKSSFNKAIKIARQSLIRQISLPLEDGTECAVCGRQLNLLYGEIFKSFGFCPKCGQRIDWEGEA